MYLKEEALKELGPEPEDAVGQMQFRTELMQRVGDVITDTVRDPSKQRSVR